MEAFCNGHVDGFPELFSTYRCCISFLWIFYISERDSLLRSLATLSDGSERLMDVIGTNTRNTQLVHDIGEALSSKRSTEDALYEVSRIMEMGLEFDCGAILLVNEDKTRLNIRAVFGYAYQEVIRLMDALEDCEDVQNAYANFDISESEIEKLG